VEQIPRDDPYPVTPERMGSLYRSGRRERFLAIMARAGFTLVADVDGAPTFRDRHGVMHDLPGACARIRAEHREQNVDLYQEWMDLAHQGY
jgi:hypothetical protein